MLPATETKEDELVYKTYKRRWLVLISAAVANMGAGMVCLL